MSSWEDKWQTVKPRAIYLAIGLVVGPFITNSLGWQVTSAAAKTEMRDSLVEQSASICAERARVEVKGSDKLDWNARTALADKWGIMPGEKTTDSDVKYACARKLEG